MILAFNFYSKANKFYYKNITTKKISTQIKGKILKPQVNDYVLLKNPTKATPNNLSKGGMKQNFCWHQEEGLFFGGGLRDEAIKKCNAKNTYRISSGCGCGCGS